MFTHFASRRKSLSMMLLHIVCGQSQRNLQRYFKYLGLNKSTLVLHTISKTWKAKPLWDNQQTAPKKSNYFLCLSISLHRCIYLQKYWIELNEDKMSPIQFDLPIKSSSEAEEVVNEEMSENYFKFVIGKKPQVTHVKLATNYKTFSGELEAAKRDLSLTLQVY